MHKNQNQIILQPLLDRFQALSEEPFKNGKRDHELDDLFAECLRAKLSPGEKSIKEENHKGTRTRMFIYRSQNGKDKVVLRALIVQGEPGKSKFTAIVRFN